MNTAPPRPVVHVGPRWTVKRYAEESQAAVEARWYAEVPWAAPELIEVSGPELVLATVTVAAHDPAWRPVRQLRELLHRLGDRGVHHRDVHTGNVVRGRDGAPLLIDWETAVQHEAEYSYDLVGPEGSGVPVPELHIATDVGPQWWGSPQPYAIGREWGAGAQCL